jgi:hypothetical protein
VAETSALEAVKQAMNITSDYQDAALSQFVTEVKAFLLDAGVSADVVESEAAHGLITCGVIDLFNYNSGEARFSSYFIQRAIQLVYTGSGIDDV